MSGVGSVCLGGGVLFVVMRVRWKGEGERERGSDVKKKKKKIRRYEMLYLRYLTCELHERKRLLDRYFGVLVVLDSTGTSVL